MKGVTNSGLEGKIVMIISTHAREGRDHANLLTYIDQRISTHTPVKGVTGNIVEFIVDTDISTHTPVKGVTCFIFC